MTLRLPPTHRRKRDGHPAAAASPYVREMIVESPVALLIVAADGARNAMTVSFFSEVAHHPTTLWVSVAQSTYTHTLIERAGAFSLAVLDRSQKDLAIACGTVSGRERDKCAALELYETSNGFLYLRHALASSACRITRRIPVADHTLFVASILAGDTESARSRHLLTSDF